MKADSSPIPPRRPPRSLRQLANRQGRKIGAAAHPDLIEKHQQYRDTLSPKTGLPIYPRCFAGTLMDTILISRSLQSESSGVSHE